MHETTGTECCCGASVYWAVTGGAAEVIRAGVISHFGLCFASHMFVLPTRCNHIVATSMCVDARDHGHGVLLLRECLLGRNRQSGRSDFTFEAASICFPRARHRRGAGAHRDAHARAARGAATRRRMGAPGDPAIIRRLLGFCPSATQHSGPSKKIVPHISATRPQKEHARPRVARGAFGRSSAAC